MEQLIPTGSWLGQRGAAAFDLRSEPPPCWMTCSRKIPLLTVRSNDVLTYLQKPTHIALDLESHVSALTGKEAGLFVVSGTMGNQVALRALARRLTQPPHSVLCDRRSHIVKYEAGGVASLCGAMLTAILPSNGRYLTLEDIQENVALGDDIHGCPTRENTLDGLIMPLAEVVRIANFARLHGILMHCDGARLWEVAAAGAGDLTDFCAQFDTISLCFSKGLGAPIGSIVVGRKSVIKQARWVRKSIGGGLRQSGVVTAAARVAIDMTFGTSPDGRNGLLPATHDTARRVAKLWTDLGGRLAKPVETNMCWLDLPSMGCSVAWFQELGRGAGLKLLSGRLITHWCVQNNQIGEEAITRLEGVFNRIAWEKEDGIQNEGDVSQARGPYGG
ncbi:pyridoxal phosphate-dependent transferase [Xylariaceae sp. FL1272]|nr:pyridoxal phosphate-dependent transferase [Xylariaceae sp. FL1272]